MAVAPIRFDSERALELVLYIARRLRYPTLHSVSKVLYFADREHLSRYGSLLSGDNYVAMRHGPVPSAIYDLMKAAAGRKEPLIPAQFYELVSQSLKVEDRRRVVPLREANLDLLSASQRECLDDSIKTNGKLSFKRLADKSHDAAWKSADENDLIEIRAIAKTLPNAKQVLAYLAD
jgi:uncharacterized phage-associated protein